MDDRVQRVHEQIDRDRLRRHSNRVLHGHLSFATTPSGNGGLRLRLSGLAARGTDVAEARKDRAMPASLPA